MRRANVGWLGLIVLVAMLAVAWPAPSFAQAQAAQAGTALKPEAVAGKYQGTANTPSGDMPLSVDLKTEKGTFAGTIESGQGPVAITGGSITGDRVTLEMSPYDLSRARIVYRGSDPRKAAGAEIQPEGDEGRGKQ